MSWNYISKILERKFKRVIMTKIKQLVLLRIIKAITLILNARLKPLAKNPPKGPITELNKDIENECKTNG